jgi:YidC/Oxa1 family membrane protein insertase
MQERSSSPGLGNILMFVVILVLALVIYPWVMAKFFPQPKVANAPAAKEKLEKKDEKAAADKKPEKGKEKSADQTKSSEKENKPKTEAEKTAKAPAPPEKAQPNKPEAPPEKKIDEPRQWVTLGSADLDPKNPFRMLITLSNEGASIVRAEFSNGRYRDLDDRSGYLGHLVMDNTDPGPGCLVQVVGEGTPAAMAGVRPGDRILQLVNNGQSTAINGPVGLEVALRSTKPGKSVGLLIQRGKDRLPTIDVTLIRRPLEAIRPERKKPDIDWFENGPLDAINLKENSPLSFLMTLQGVDDKNPNNLPPDIDADAKWEEELTREMPGVSLRSANWHIDSVSREHADGPATKVVFSCPVPQYHLTIIKSYELVKVEGDPATEPDAKAYNLVLSLQAVNNDTKRHEIAYRLDGPNGLPVEGAWFVTSKVGRTWAGEGLRDVIYELAKSDVSVATAMQLSDKFHKVIGESTEFTDHPPLFYGVDAQYFSVVMLPVQSTAVTIERALGFRMGEVAEQRKTLTNTSFRLISKMIPLEPDNKPVTLARYEVFAGPKRPALLAKYDLSGVICYGWPIFQWVAVPMTYILDFFYGIVRNYGLAIIMLTIVVRLAFFPISRKQAQSAQLMQKIQPKLKELEKKYKGDWKALQAARQELLAKYNYNPSSGCLLLLLQLPVFIGLYRALQVNVELRDAPLLTHAIRWCSNLAAPDMLYDWSWFMPAAVNNGMGFPWFPLFGSMLGLGPYLNLFPIITLGLFLAQQKVMMPPAADEQAAQQQKIMKYVMFLMGFMFFKVAAGLCIYFIATTLWGLAERRFMPKPASADGESSAAEIPSRVERVERLSNSEREAIRRKKRGGKK